MRLGQCAVLRLLLAVVGLAWTCSFVVVVAQESSGTPSARRELERGQAAMKGHDYVTAEAAFRRAVELDPAWPEAHSSFQTALRRVAGAQDNGFLDRAAGARYDELLRQQYETWLKAHPKTAGYLVAYADVVRSNDVARSEALCRDAVAADPHFARAYYALASFAEVRGDPKATTEMLRKAAEAAPGNAEYSYRYAKIIAQTDPAAGVELTLRMIDRFPIDPLTRSALWDLAVAAGDSPEAVTYLDRIRKTVGVEVRSAEALARLVTVYGQTDAAKALREAESIGSMLAAANAAPWWPQVVSLWRTITAAQDLMAAGKLAEAQAFLDADRRVGYVNQPEIPLLRAEIDARVGRFEQAYERSADLYAAGLTQSGGQVEAFRHARVKRALDGYGERAGKSRATIDADIHARWARNASPAPAFSLVSYADGRAVALSDLRGKVVLLNFFFPT